MKRDDVLLLVAHPDDDVIFAHHLQSQWCHLEWHVVCVTGDQAMDDVRSKEFMSYQTSMIAKNIWNLQVPEAKMVDNDAFITEVYEKIKTYNPRLIVTHNAQGEYGHKHHQIVHKVAQKFEGVNKLYFGYGIQHIDFQVFGPNKQHIISQHYPTQKWVNSVLFTATNETFIWDKDNL